MSSNPINYRISLLNPVSEAKVNRNIIKSNKQILKNYTENDSSSDYEKKLKEKSILNDYIENKIFSIDPFISIDDGVGDLVEIAVEKGRKQNKKIKLGICGEHGGDPKSIHFCARAGLDYVSCSPYRVPIARLAAAQAEISKKLNF